MKNLFFAAIAVFFTLTTSFATTVVPFDNLGHLAENCDDVVLVKVLSFNNPEINDFTSNYSWNVQIVKSFKGNLSAQAIIPITGQGSASTTKRTKIEGDIKMEVGETYLLFLDHNDAGVWRPQTLSYYAYKEMKNNNKQYYVPVKESLDIHTDDNPDMLFVLDAKKFNVQLDQHVKDQFKFGWSDPAIRSNIAAINFYPATDAPPAHCATVGFRWNIWDTGANTLNVYSNLPNDLDLPGSDGHTEVGNSIIELETNYGGIDLLNAGTTSFTPTCLSGGSPSSVHESSNFFTHTNTLNGGDCIIVVFDDPCDQIPDLVGCNGTLAQGGSWAFGPSYVYDGANYFVSGNAFCVVNNDITTSSPATSCQTAADYRIMLTHEMTHAINLGHIAGSGTANMNPSCCNLITTLDQQCIDYLYPATVPVKLTHFTGSNETGINTLQWTTETESNSEFFEIQRSTDGISFIGIGKVDAAGTSLNTRQYNYSDRSAPNTKTYYRLKQMDYNGDFEYSHTISLTGRSDARDFSFSPNPAYNQLYFKNYEGGQIQILSPMGQQMINTQASSTLDISALPVGLYIINYTQGTTSYTESFVKL